MTGQGKNPSDRPQWKDLGTSVELRGKQTSLDKVLTESLERIKHALEDSKKKSRMLVGTVPR